MKEFHFAWNTSLMGNIFIIFLTFSCQARNLKCNFSSELIQLGTFCGKAHTKNTCVKRRVLGGPLQVLVGAARKAYDPATRQEPTAGTQQRQCILDAIIPLPHAVSFVGPSERSFTTTRLQTTIRFFVFGFLLLSSLLQRSLHNESRGSSCPLYSSTRTPRTPSLR